MTYRYLLTALCILSGACLPACGQRSDKEITESDPFAKRSSGKADQFGKGFGEAFRADPNSEPANVADGDVIPVSQTDEPVAFD